MVQGQLKMRQFELGWPVLADVSCSSSGRAMNSLLCYSVVRQLIAQGAIVCYGLSSGDTLNDAVEG